MGIPQMKSFCSITAVLCMTTNCLLCTCRKVNDYFFHHWKSPCFASVKLRLVFQRLICGDRKRWWGEVKRLNGLHWIYGDLSNNISIEEIN